MSIFFNSDKNVFTLYVRRLKKVAPHKRLIKIYIPDGGIQ